MNRVLYGVHRWIALIALAQLTIWSVTGLVFSVLPLNRVRGEDAMSKRAAQAIPWEHVRPLPESFQHGATEVLLRMVDGRPAYEVRSGEGKLLIDSAIGVPREVDAELAGHIARVDQVGSPPIRDIRRVEEAAVEYRDKPLPAWRVDLDDERGTRIYIDARAGTVTARRNNLWRFYDFLWGLHIMDYGGRDNFNNLLLTSFAALGVATAVTGTAIWAARAIRRLRRRRMSSPSATTSP